MGVQSAQCTWLSGKSRPACLRPLLVLGFSRQSRAAVCATSSSSSLSISLVPLRSPPSCGTVCPFRQVVTGHTDSTVGSSLLKHFCSDIHRHRHRPHKADWRKQGTGGRGQATQPDLCCQIWLVQYVIRHAKTCSTACVCAVVHTKNC